MLAILLSLVTLAGKSSEIDIYDDIEMHIDSSAWFNSDNWYSVDELFGEDGSIINKKCLTENNCFCRYSYTHIHHRFSNTLRLFDCNGIVDNHQDNKYNAMKNYDNYALDMIRFSDEDDIDEEDQYNLRFSNKRKGSGIEFDGGNPTKVNIGIGVDCPLRTLYFARNSSFFIINKIFYSLNMLALSDHHVIPKGELRYFWNWLVDHNFAQFKELIKGLRDQLDHYIANDEVRKNDALDAQRYVDAKAELDMVCTNHCLHYK